MYGLFSGFVLSRDYLFTSLSSVYEKIFVGSLIGISGMSIIAMLFLLVSAIKELKIRKSMQKYGEGYNRKTKQYEY
jgi:FtsH-binding integral membrane protein